MNIAAFAQFEGLIIGVITALVILGEMMEKANAKGNTIILSIGGDGSVHGSDFAPVEHLRQKLEAEKK